MQLNKDPIGPPLDGDGRVLPEPQAAHGWRIDSRQFAVLDARKRPAALPAAKIDQERSLNDQRKSAGSAAALQVEAPAVGRSPMEGQGAFVERVDLANLRGGRRG